MTSYTQEQILAAQRALVIRDASKNFEAFVRAHYPKWELPDFQLKLIHALDDLIHYRLFPSAADAINEAAASVTEPIRNLLITMPPRHAKTTFASILLPCFYLGQDPSRYVMSSSYNARLAADFGREVRNLVKDPLTSQIFPDFLIAKDSSAADVWRTEADGAYFGIGLGGTTSGRPANLLNIDDPIKSREEAESATMRDKVWDFYTGSLENRRQPDRQNNQPLQIITLTRWHPDDLAGRIQKTEDWKEGLWHHINFPAMWEEAKPTPTKRTMLPLDHPKYINNPEELAKLPDQEQTIQEYEEKALWPERFPIIELKRKQRLNPRDFASLYLQNPYIEGGNILKTEWWQRYPSELNPDTFPVILIGMDTAFKKTETSDYSVAVIIGIDQNGDIYIIDVQRGKWDFPDLKQRVILLNNRYRGKGLRAFYIEDKASGQSLLQELKRESGVSVIPYKVNSDKVARVNSVAPLIEGGRVFIPDKAHWLDVFIDECVSFPSGTNDDIVDALVIALDAASKTSISPNMMAAQQNLSLALNNTFNPDKTNSLNTLFKKNSTFKGWGT